MYDMQSFCRRWLSACRSGPTTMAASALPELASCTSNPTGSIFKVSANGSAELASDAIVKYQDSVRRTTEAFNELKMKNLKLVPGGLSYKESAGGAANVGMAAITGRGAPAGKPKVEVSQVFRLSLRGIDQLSEQELMETIAKILDTAKDSGAAQNASPKSGMAQIMIASMGGSGAGQSPVTFIYEDGNEVRQKAYEKAFADAQANASRLAGVAHVKLGPVLNIEELATSAGDKSTNAQMTMIKTMYGLDSEGKDEDSTGISDDEFGEIPVRVNLRVRFGIE